MKTLHVIIVAFTFFLFVTAISGQTLTATGHDISRVNEKGEPAGTDSLINTVSYAFSAQSGVGLEDMSSGTTQLIGPGADDTNSPATQIGFAFRYDGVFYTTFGVNSNGFARLGTAISGSGTVNSISDATNSPKIMPYWDNLCVGSGGRVHSKTVGAPGSRKLVIEWSNMKITRGSSCDGSGSGTFQLWLFERIGVVQFVYGNGMTVSSASDSGYSVGIQSGSTSNFASVTTSNSTVSYTTANNSQIAAINPGTSYVFTPNMPLAPSNGLASPVTQTTVTLNWTDNANDETGYLVRRTTDNVNFITVANLAPNSNSYTDTGLEPGTQYFFYVSALSDGAMSPDLVVSATTNPAGTVSATAAGGLWSSPSTWASGAIPAAGDNVTIPSGSTVIIDTAAVARSVTIGNVGSLAETEKRRTAEGGAPAVLRFGETAAFSLSVVNDVTIGANDSFTTGGGNANQHVLAVGRDLINNGTLDLSTNNGLAGALIKFNGSSNSTFGGAGAVTDVMTIDVDKTLPGAIVELTASNFTVQGSATDTPASGYLYLYRGIFKISGTFSGTHRTFPNAAYSIAPVAGFWLNNPNYIVAAQHGSASNYGYLRMTAGTLNVGTAFNDHFLLREGSNVLVEGGNINTAGVFIELSNGVVPFFYNQTGGTVTACTVGQDTNDGCFGMGGHAVGLINVSITGGEIVIQNASTGLGEAYRYLVPESLAASNATVRFGNAFTTQPSIFRSQGHFPNNLIIDTAAGGHILQIQGFSLGNRVGNVNIGPGGTLDVGAQTFNVYGETFINNGFIKGTDTNQSKLTFWGANPVYSGSGGAAGIFGGFDLRSQTFTMNTSGQTRIRRLNLYSGDLIGANKFTIGNNDAVLNRILIGNPDAPGPVGNFDSSPVFEVGTGGYGLTYINGGNRTTGGEISPARTLAYLEYSPNQDTDTLTLAGGDITVKDMALHRGIINARQFAILHYGNLASFPHGFVDGTLIRKFAALVPYTFRVGSAGKSSPVIFDPHALGTNPSYLSVSAETGTLPGLLPATSVSRYWKFQEVGDITGGFILEYPGSDARGNPDNYKLWYSNGGPPVLVPNFVNQASSQRMASPQNVTELTGNWGIGEQLDPGPVSVSGTVTTAGGQPIANAILTISGGNLPAPVTTQTGSFGTYQFSNLQAGETYTIRVDAKRFRFSPVTRQVTPMGNVSDVNFVANP